MLFDEHIFVLGAPETILPFCTGQDEEVEEIRASYQAASGVGLRGVLLAEAEVFPNVDIGLKSLKLRALNREVGVPRPCFGAVAPGGRKPMVTNSKT